MKLLGRLCTPCSLMYAERLRFNTPKGTYSSLEPGARAAASNISETRASLWTLGQKSPQSGPEIPVNMCIEPRMVSHLTQMRSCRGSPQLSGTPNLEFCDRCWCFFGVPGPMSTPSVAAILSSRGLGATERSLSVATGTCPSHASSSWPSFVEEGNQAQMCHPGPSNKRAGSLKRKRLRWLRCVTQALPTKERLRCHAPFSIRGCASGKGRTPGAAP